MIFSYFHFSFHWFLSCLYYFLPIISFLPSFLWDFLGFWSYFLEMNALDHFHPFFFYNIWPEIYQLPSKEHSCIIQILTSCVSIIIQIKIFLNFLCNFFFNPWVIWKWNSWFLNIWKFSNYLLLLISSSVQRTYSVYFYYLIFIQNCFMI